MSHEHRPQLESITRSKALLPVLARRVLMLLPTDDGEFNSELARRFGVNLPTATLLRTRFRERGMVDLHNGLKLGRPGSTEDEAIAELITLRPIPSPINWLSSENVGTLLLESEAHWRSPA